MNTIHQIPFVTKEIRHKLIEDGKPYFEDSFRKTTHTGIPQSKGMIKKESSKTIWYH